MAGEIFVVLLTACLLGFSLYVTRRPPDKPGWSDCGPDRPKQDS